MFAPQGRRAGVLGAVACYDSGGSTVPPRSVHRIVKGFDFNDIVESYQQHSGVLGILKGMKEGGVVRVGGLPGSSAPLLFAVICRLSGWNGLMISDSRARSYQFVSDLQTFQPGFPCRLFPSSYRKAYHFAKVESANILQRNEMLETVRRGRPGEPIGMVTYPDALHEKVPDPASHKGRGVQLDKGSRVDVQTLIDKLEGLNFIEVSGVGAPGEYALRGGIVDIFDYSGRNPCRLEFQDDLIESIRLFNVQTQRSHTSLERATVVRDLDSRHFQGKTVNFLDYVSTSGCFLWVENNTKLSEIIREGFSNAEVRFQQLSKMSDHIRMPSDMNQGFCKSESLQDSLDRFPIIDTHLPSSSGRAKHVFSFGFQPQPSFNRKIDLLKEDLSDLQSAGYSTYVFSDSSASISRLGALLEQDRIEMEGVPRGLSEGFVDNESMMVCYSDHQIFQNQFLPVHDVPHPASKSLRVRDIKDLEIGDFVVHADYGIARYGGLALLDVKGKSQEGIRLVFRDNDLLYLNVHSLHKLSMYAVSNGVENPKTSKLGSPEWERKRSRAKQGIKKVARNLIGLYAKRKLSKGHSFRCDPVMEAQFEAGFPFTETEDQSKANLQVREDMEKSVPMDRLICGDVGFGKTEIAIRSAFRCVADGKQAVVLVPTTILAFQHYNTFRERMKDTGIEIDYMNRLRAAQDVRMTRERVSSGKTGILIGTQMVISKELSFRDLGLLIVDEEHRFGVAVKERIKEMRTGIDTLTMTATPIPRTLNFSLLGARDLSIIATPPLHRLPIKTETFEYSEEIIRDSIRTELRRGGQVFFVHNRISDIERMTNIIGRLVPDARVSVSHGKMRGPELERIMMKFIGGEVDVLVCTNIIESGIDIQNANTIIINDAHRFGLADLHQIRGRVGRSDRQAHCYHLIPVGYSLGGGAAKRLGTIEEFTRLGDGFLVAMRDLEIRGAGNLLGDEQSGFIDDMGFDSYQRILDEAIGELKEEEFKHLFDGTEDSVPRAGSARRCQFETDQEILIPEDYVQDASQRLKLYGRIDQLLEDEQIEAFAEELKDRFGPIPKGLETLIGSVRLRNLAGRMNASKVVVRGGRLACYYNKNVVSSCANLLPGILKYVNAFPGKVRLREKQNGEVLGVEITGVDTIQMGFDQMGVLSSTIHSEPSASEIKPWQGM